MKKLSVLVLSALLLIGSVNIVSAQTSYEYEVPNDEKTVEPIRENFGVSTEVPSTPEKKEGEISVFGTWPPGASHDVIKDGRMTFKGYAQSSILYTNSNFTGASSYKIQIQNNSYYELRVDLIKNGALWDTTVKTYYVSPHFTKYAYPYDLDPDADYYLKFSAPSEFEGYVEH